MYAIVHTGGKQYRMEEGQTFRVEKLKEAVGASVVFDQVLMYSDGENVEIGRPVLGNIRVKARIVEQDKHKKIIVFKYKRRKNFRRKQGHRQAYTGVKVERIADITREDITQDDDVKQELETASTIDTQTDLMEKAETQAAEIDDKTVDEDQE